MPLVSVVIPAYNAAEWIAETIESVLQQTYDDLEVIVVNDGSIDRTVGIAEEILRKGQFPYRIVDQENSGPSSSRNRGWRTARGTWIQFLDADDLLHPRKIEVQVREQHANPAADVIYSDWQSLRWTGSAWEKEKYVRTPVIGEDALADVLQTGNFIHLGSALLSLGALRRVGGFDESHWLIEDVELHIKLAMGKGVFVKAPSNEPLSWYRDRAHSLSKCDPTAFVEGCIRNAKLAEQHIRQAPDQSHKIVEAVLAVYYQGARYFAEHDWNRFEQLLIDIHSLEPAFLPKTPLSLRALSRVLGYRNAEQVAFFYRRLKNWDSVLASSPDGQRKAGNPLQRV
jgi:glycosyltransferase involved in cell wall biosynthesis